MNETWTLILFLFINGNLKEVRVPHIVLEENCEVAKKEYIKTFHIDGTNQQSAICIAIYE